ncbi:hypothetical protein TIFTF001_038042 [Ficus carica]|uniref:Uncharacterized protein n=1 Tax=Ficus carica TaxID=3494 RepID=A0AA88JCG3_FICCA|nr:hypothetical protein TIFTF001_038042 [Ficus carica]
MLLEGWVGAVSESSVESWSPFIVLKSECVRRKGSWIPRELGCRAVVRGLDRCVGLHCRLWVACVHDVQPVFPPCCKPSFHNGPIALMVTPVLMGVALPKVAVVTLFSFVYFMYLFVIRVEVSPLVPRVGFCVDRVLAVVWLGVIWWANLAFASPIVGVILHVWDRGLFRLFSSGLIICVLSYWFVDFISIWWFPSRSVACR